MQKLYYVANARMPTEKAHGIQIAKMCEALIEEGVDVTLVVPRRGSVGSIREFYGLRQDIPVVTLPAVNNYHKGRVWYYLSSYSFVVSYYLYLQLRVDAKDAVVYTVDLDQFSYRALSHTSIPFFSEMHGAKPKNALHEKFFFRALGIIPTNHITKKELQEQFHLPDAALLVEPNGVDVAHFTPIAAPIAREQLGLPRQGTIALYIGRFFAWKGLGILSDVATVLPKSVQLGVVGGTAQEYAQVTGRAADPHIHFFGSQPYTSMPLWNSAADVLVVLGTRDDEQSYRYTSPMKLFEYMAMRRPIVASRTPALQDILSEEECFFYEPDSAEDLARAIAQAINPHEAEQKVVAAFRKVAGVSWKERARRVRQFMNRRLADTNKEV